MLYPEPITGKSLGMPAGEIALTFDDGPGDQTRPIAEYLYRKGIEATFFVTGSNYELLPELVHHMGSKLGHQVGYHTMNHYDLPSVYQNAPWRKGRDEMQMPEGFYNGGKEVYFRAPYNRWNRQLADWFAPQPFHGPFGFDYGCDWIWAQHGNSFRCDQAYENAIRGFLHGTIILFHDNIADRRSIRNNLHTLEVLKLLIPVLLHQGYKFKRLDEVAVTKTVTAS